MDGGPGLIRYLQLEPTTRCNYSCGFCAGRTMDQSDLDPGRVAGLLAALPELGHVELQGEGEPLLHPGFFDLVAAFRARGVSVSFISNGSLLSEARIDRILALGVEKISVSLESARGELFKELRGGSLEKVERNLAALLAERRRRSLARPVVGLSITVLRGTEAELDAILDLYERLGLDGGVTVQPLERKADYAAHYRPEILARTLDAAAADEVWIRFRTHPRIRAIEARRAPVQGFFDGLMAGWMPARRRCPWLEQGLYVDRHGRVGACCMIKDEGQLIGHVDRLPEAVAARDRMAAELRAGRLPAACAGCDLGRFAVMGWFELARYGARGMWARLGLDATPARSA